MRAAKMESTSKPLTLKAEALSELSEEPGFVLLREGANWRIYHHPVQVLSANDSQTLASTLARLDQHIEDGGEAAGFVSYEAGYALEPRLYRRLIASKGPLCWFCLYDHHSVLDVGSIPANGTEEIVQNSASTITRAQYDQALDSIHNLIAAGDVYQVNFTYRMTFQFKCSPWQLFAALCHRHPVPYAAFVNTGSEQIVSLSPELFFDIRGRHIVVKPMKGTADRGLTLEDDNRCAKALHMSEKNRAENVMIVDLMRNDLGRICRLGSVKTPKLFEVERLPSVWQMTSTIEGDLRDECTPDSILRALFPSGSVTGAPKIRAMEVISELESSDRGVYTGAIGYFAPNRAQFNVAIRTAVVHDGNGLIGVGSGITHDSSSPDEWQECESKMGFLTRSEMDFKIIETLRWEKTYWLLQEHLDRLRVSAEYFGFQFVDDKAREALQQVAFRFEDRPQKVRVLLSQNGSIELDHSDLDTAFFGRVRLSSQRVMSTDRFLYHKTTRRKMYNEELVAAKTALCDDALFFNERDELTEGTIHNVFVVTGGVWRTPPLACGVLAGTYRAYLLGTCPNAREEVLALNDLACADEIYLCNSVRGIFPVRLSLAGF
jgi:para-aminobenzoate synthetase / 4-amino-4-deoxychorismate lyase